MTEEFIWEDNYKEVTEPPWYKLVKEWPGRWLWITNPEAKLGPFQAGKLVSEAKRYDNEHIEAVSVPTEGFFTFAVKARWVEKKGDDNG